MEIQGLDILLRLLTAHLLADFLLQPDSWVKDRQSSQLKSKFFWFHMAIVGIATYVLLGEWKNWQIPAIITGTHLLIDITKILYKKDSITAFLLDQFAHITVIILVWLGMTEQWQWAGPQVSKLFSSEKFWLITMGYIINTMPLAVFIRYLTRRWSEEIELAESKRENSNNKKEREISSLKDAGKWIGIIERGLIFTFILFKEFQAIGFLLAAKSVFRFGDLKETTDRNKTEYILIGTLISFASSICIGLLIVNFLK